MKVSLIISTYNWPSALELVLRSVSEQIQMPDEVVIADDGSTDETKQVINDFQQMMTCPIQHVWHEDQGFRLAMIRNKAIAKCSGDYVVMIDGDCLLRPSFIQRHVELSDDNCFIAGNRVLLAEKFTETVLTEKVPIQKWSMSQFKKHQINRRWALMILPMFKKLRQRNNKWQGVKTCNISMYKKDFVAVNGFDETFEGWGYEDSELVVRLLRKGLNKIDGRFYTTVLHLWHASNINHQQSDNWQKFQQTLCGDKLQSHVGINQL